MDLASKANSNYDMKDLETNRLNAEPPRKFVYFICLILLDFSSNLNI